MLYKSTRNDKDTLKASQAIVQGISNDGGLYVPEIVPKLDKSLEELSKLNYKEVAYEVMKLFLTDFTEEELKLCINNAYSTGFDSKEPIELTKVGEDFFLELYHGRTIAFKDMALSILPYLMTVSAKKNQVTNKLVIVTATSGDTGKAALAGFADVDNTEIIVFYPKDGVSAVQERQMVTQEGSNTHVIAINGNFDDAQTAVKDMMEDSRLKKELLDKGLQFSSANSINIGRLVPQIVYYVYSYAQLLNKGEVTAKEKINFVVPTGNFGNILAANYARLMGVPINKLICASNDNKVLVDFFETGQYNRNREFVVTTSPSMDILISSNLERLVSMLTDQDSKKTKKYMSDLKTTGSYSLDEDEKKGFKNFHAGFSNIDETSNEIDRVFKKDKYLIDPHTAVASKVLYDYKKTTLDKSVSVIASTASPYKFPATVLEALGHDKGDDFNLFARINKISEMPIPEAVRGLSEKEILHNRVIEADEIKSETRRILGLN